MFQELDHWFVQDFTPIWNWTWLCNKMASTGKNLSLRVQPEEKPLVSEPQNKPPTFAMEDNFTWKNWQTSRVYSDFRHWDLTGGFLWGFFFFQLNEVRCHFKGNRRHYFFFTDNKIQSFKKNTNFRYSYLLPRAWQLPRQLFLMNSAITLAKVSLVLHNKKHYCWEIYRSDTVFQLTNTRLWVMKRSDCKAKTGDCYASIIPERGELKQADPQSVLVWVQL